MNELTPRRVLELGGPHFQRARILALAESAGRGIALIDVHGDGARTVVGHYARDDDGIWHAVRRPVPVETAPSGPTHPGHDGQVEP